MDFRTFVIQFFVGSFITTGSYFFLRRLAIWHDWQARMLFIVVMGFVNALATGRLLSPALLAYFLVITVCFMWRFVHLSRTSGERLSSRLMPYPLAIMFLSMILLLPLLAFALYFGLGITSVDVYWVPLAIFCTMLASFIRSEGREAFFTVCVTDSMFLNLMSIAILSFMDGQTWGYVLRVILERLRGDWVLLGLFRFSLLSAFVGWIDFIGYKRWREY